MKRKLVKQGGSALTITLPAKWAKKHNLKPGDEIEINETGDQIIIATSKIGNEQKIAMMNIDDLDRVMLNRYLEEFYELGTEQIILTFTKDTISYYKERKKIPLAPYVHKIVERFIGLEIISQSNSRIVIQSMMHQDDPQKMESVQHRIYFLIKELLEEFLKAMDGDFKPYFSTLYERHDNLAKFTVYLEKIIRSANIDDQQKQRLLVLYSITSKILDKVRHTGEKVAKIKKPSPKLKAALKEIFTFYPTQFEVVLKKEYTRKDMETLLKKRYDLVEKINNEKFSQEDSEVICECKIMLDTILEFMQYFAAKDAQKYLMTPAQDGVANRPSIGQA